MAKPRSDVFLANHHTGPIVLPRIYAPNLTGDPTQNKIICQSRTIPAGTSVPIPWSEWEERKKGTALKHYMDRGILALVRKEGEVALTDQTTSELEVPEHLRAGEVVDESKTSQGGRIASSVKKATKGTVTF